MRRMIGMGVAALLLALGVPGPGRAQDAEFGGQLFASFCAACHGADATGGGELSAILALHPPDLTQLAAMNGGVFPTARVARQIDGRDPELVHGGVMPLFGTYFDFPDAAIPAEDGQPILTAAPIADLVAWLQAVQQ
ncbi:c-type cytochrome [Palleronia sp. KMU-117]|uniref:c-type cytochrome n=1 Tax=Palleronia sp. KMU-117 TaxID=3434108 RepID=UPI003D740E54